MKIIIAGLVVLIVVAIIEQVKICKRRKRPQDYNFNLNDEFRLYKEIGSPKSKSALKHFSDWEEKRIKPVIDQFKSEKDRTNFCHYLNRLLRDQKSMKEGIVALVIPVEIFMCTGVLNNDCTYNPESRVIVIIFTTIVLVALLTTEISKCNHWIDFYRDVIDIVEKEDKLVDPGNNSDKSSEHSA